MSGTPKQQWMREYRQKRNIARHALRDKALDALGGCCVVCATTEDLQFDHVDPDTKLFNISTGITDYGDSPLLWTELAKCQILCRPHHEVKSKADGPHARCFPRGERHHASKLRSLDVLYIRELSSLGYSQHAIAREFEVGRSTIEDILHWRTWRHV